MLACERRCPSILKNMKKRRRKLLAAAFVVENVAEEASREELLTEDAMRTGEVEEISVADEVRAAADVVLAASAEMTLLHRQKDLHHHETEVRLDANKLLTILTN